MRLTLKTINTALYNLGIKAELCKGQGYFYFIGDDVDLTSEQGVYGVYKLNGLSLNQWIEEAKDKCK